MFGSEGVDFNGCFDFIYFNFCGDTGFSFYYYIDIRGISLFFETLKPMLIISAITIILYVFIRWFSLEY